MTCDEKLFPQKKRTCNKCGMVQWVSDAHDSEKELECPTCDGLLVE